MAMKQWWLLQKWLFCRWLCQWTAPLVVRYALDNEAVCYQIVCKGKETLIFYSREFGELIARQGVDFAYSEKTGKRLSKRIRRLDLPDKITQNDRKVLARYAMTRSEVLEQPDFRSAFEEA